MDPLLKFRSLTRREQRLFCEASVLLLLSNKPEDPYIGTESINPDLFEELGTLPINLSGHRLTPHYETAQKRLTDY